MTEAQQLLTLVACLALGFILLGLLAAAIDKYFLKEEEEN